tara:strand:- start:336 stop:491 length:156 start_codon:yes stop_codon:yes gene_type:complete
MNKKPLRIGLLLNRDTIPTCTYKMLDQIINSERSELVLRITKGNMSSKNKI